MSLILNPRAAIDTSGTSGATGGETITSDTATFDTAPASFKIVTPGGGASFEGIVWWGDNAASVRIQGIQPGGLYKVCPKLKGNTGGESLLIKVSWNSALTGSGTLISGPTKAITLTTSFASYEWTLTAPAGAVSCLVQILTAGTAAYTFWADTEFSSLVVAAPFPLEFVRAQLNPLRQPWMLTRALNINGSQSRDFAAPTTGAAAVTATITSARTVAATTAGVSAFSTRLARTKQVAATPTGVAAVVTAQARARTVRASPAGAATPTGNLGTPVSATYGASYYGLAHYGTTDTPGLKAIAATAAGTATPTVSVRRASAVRATVAAQAQTTVGFRGTALLAAAPTGQAATTAALVTSNPSTGLTPRGTGVLVLTPRPSGTV